MHKHDILESKTLLLDFHNENGCHHVHKIYSHADTDTFAQNNFDNEKISSPVPDRMGCVIFLFCCWCHRRFFLRFALALCLCTSLSSSLSLSFSVCVDVGNPNFYLARHKPSQKCHENRSKFAIRRVCVLTKFHLVKNFKN